MAKITGSEGILGLRTGVATHGTSVQLGANRALAFDSLEYNDNPELVEFSTKGVNRVMKDDVRFGIKKPNLSLTYKLKYGGQGMNLIKGFFGTQTTPTEQTGSQGDYKSEFYFNTTRQFYTIGFQSTSATSMVWASCYPVAVNISASIGQPVTVKVDFVTTPRAHSDATVTFANLATTTETTTASYLLLDTSSIFIMDNRGDGNWSTSDAFPITGFNQTYSRPMEVMPEANNTTSYPAPVSTGLFTATTQINFNGYDDHTLHTIYSTELEKEISIGIYGSAIGTGLQERVSLVSGRVKINQDLSANISSDGFNAGSVTFEHLYSATTQTSGYTMPSIVLVSKDSFAYSTN